MTDVEIISMERVHSDDRRAIHESDLSENFELVRVNHIAVTENGPQRLGDHHHNEMNELFVLAAGTIELLVVSNAGVLGKRRGIEAPALIHMPAGVDHTFVLAPGSVLLTLSDRPFSEEDIIPAAGKHASAVGRLMAPV